jgi:Mlc titration factor MtfA (ptsG expression regulator)
MKIILVFIIIFSFITYLFFRKKPSKAYSFNIEIAPFLEENVLFFRKLSVEKKSLFIAKMKEFLGKVKITGIHTDVNEEDKALIAAAAIIPIFQFDFWFYPNLKEVILYPNGFDRTFNLENQPILGMVGNRFLNGKMLLSKKSLYFGFHNKTDKRNTAIHEFVHLIDMADGAVDGIPEILMNERNTLPWIDLMYQTIKNIKIEESDIDDYGAFNEAEFLSVVSEYFFERPELFKRKHPKLYDLMNKTFRSFEK